MREVGVLSRADTMLGQSPGDRTRNLAVQQPDPTAYSFGPVSVPYAIVERCYLAIVIARLVALQITQAKQ